MTELEMFEMDCAHVAEVVMGTLCSLKNENAFMTFDINNDLFNSSFFTVVARFLGGSVVNENTISFMGKMITFDFTVNSVVFGNIEELEIIYYIQ
jgi:hypothetical protein